MVYKNIIKYSVLCLAINGYLSSYTQQAYADKFYGVIETDPVTKKKVISKIPVKLISYESFDKYAQPKNATSEQLERWKKTVVDKAQLAILKNDLHVSSDTVRKEVIAQKIKNKFPAFADITDIFLEIITASCTTRIYSHCALSIFPAELRDYIKAERKTWYQKEYKRRQRIEQRLLNKFMAEDDEQ